MNVKIKYSIISRGTEKYIKHGYMGVSYPVNKKQYILDIDHGIINSEINDRSLEFKADKYSISNISFSRFELIPELFLKRFKIRDNILILGLGSIGIASLVALLSKGYKKINIYTKKVFNDLNVLEKYYNTELNIVNKIEDRYNTYIDTTGSSTLLNELFDKIGYMKNIILFSSPRDNDFLINPLIINRKSLTINGFHELNGIERRERLLTYNKILEKNLILENILNKFVTIYDYNDKIIEKLIENKGNYIDVIRYRG